MYNIYYEMSRIFSNLPLYLFHPTDEFPWPISLHDLFYNTPYLLLIFLCATYHINLMTCCYVLEEHITWFQVILIIFLLRYLWGVKIFKSGTDGYGSGSFLVLFFCCGFGVNRINITCFWKGYAVVSIDIVKAFPIRCYEFVMNAPVSVNGTEVKCNFF